MKIDEQGLLITAPKRTPDTDLEAFFLQNRDWVETHLMKTKERYARFSIHHHQNCRWFLIEGQWLPIEEKDADVDWTDIIQENGKLCVIYPQLLHSRGDLLERLQDWTAARTLARAQELIAKHALKLRKKPSAVRSSKAKTKWGSCTAKGVIHLHRRLYQLHPEALKYVVIHELAHLIHLDHSRNFWAEVNRLMPTYKEAQARLFTQNFPYYGASG